MIRSLYGLYKLRNIFIENREKFQKGGMRSKIAELSHVRLEPQLFSRNIFRRADRCLVTTALSALY